MACGAQLQAVADFAAANLGAQSNTLEAFSAGRIVDSAIADTSGGVRSAPNSPSSPFMAKSSHQSRESHSTAARVRGEEGEDAHGAEAGGVGRAMWVAQTRSTHCKCRWRATWAPRS